jgi:hypothetical protein
VVIGVILLENGINVSVDQTIVGIIVRVGNNAESELFRVIKIDLINLIESLGLFKDVLLGSFGGLIRSFAWRIRDNNISFVINFMCNIEQVNSLSVLLIRNFDSIILRVVVSS